jgi:hypothetical protein
MSPKDLAECQVLVDAILKNHDIVPAATTSGRGGRAIYCGIHQTNPFIPDLYTRVSVYEFTDRNEQDRLLATVRQAKMRDYKPVNVRFFEKEVWIREMSDGRLARERQGEETLLRSEVVR